MAIASLVLLVVAAPTATAGGPVTVLGTRAWELNPAASAHHIAWDILGKNSYDVYEKRFGGSRVHVNPNGTDGSVGAIDGTKLVYQQWVSEDPGSYSDIYLFDLQTHRRTKLPPLVNSVKWEYDPGLSGRWLSFARWSPSEHRKLFLYNRMSGELRGLAITSGSHVLLDPGQVNGGFVVYDITRYNRHFSRPMSCEVYRYNIQSEKTVHVPNEGPKCQYGASVSSAGTVFFARSGFGCGFNARLVRYPVGGQLESVVSFPSGHDLFNGTYAVDNGDNTTDLYYDYATCARDPDIKRVTVAT